jgi:hypothetical protein
MKKAVRTRPSPLSPAEYTAFGRSWRNESSEMWGSRRTPIAERQMLHAVRTIRGVGGENGLRNKGHGQENIIGNRKQTGEGMRIGAERALLTGGGRRWSVLGMPQSFGRSPRDAIDGAPRPRVHPVGRETGAHRAVGSRLTGENAKSRLQQQSKRRDESRRASPPSVVAPQHASPRKYSPSYGMLRYRMI